MQYKSVFLKKNPADYLNTRAANLVPRAGYKGIPRHATTITGSPYLFMI